MGGKAEGDEGVVVEMSEDGGEDFGWKGGESGHLGCWSESITAA